MKKAFSSGLLNKDVSWEKPNIRSAPHPVMFALLVLISVCFCWTNPTYAARSDCGPPAGLAYASAIHPTNANILYAGTYGGGIFQSNDADRGWNCVSSGMTSLHAASVATGLVNAEITDAGAEGEDLTGADVQQIGSLTVTLSPAD